MTMPQSMGEPPKPPTRTAIGTAELNPKPSKEQIVAAVKEFSQYELRWLLQEIQKLMRSNVNKELRRERVRHDKKRTT